MLDCVGKHDVGVTNQPLSETLTETAGLDGTQKGHRRHLFILAENITGQEICYSISRPFCCKSFYSHLVYMILVYE